MRLTWDAVELEFLRHPDSLFLVGASSSGEVFKVASAAVLNSTAGRASWRRLARAQFYLSHAARALGADMLFVADMQDMPTPSPNASIPRLTGSAAACTPTLPMPIPLKGFGSGDLELLLARRPNPARELPPWEERRDRAAWRGTARIYPPYRTCLPRGQRWDEHPRGLLVTLSREEPELLDAGFTSIGPSKAHWTRGELARLNPKAADERLASFKKAPISFEALAAHRFQVEVDGSGFQASLAAKLLTGSTVLSQASHFPLWYEPSLVDGEHYVRVAPDLADLAAQLRSLRRQPERARAIGAAGARRMRELLSQGSIQRHVTQTVAAYARRFSSTYFTAASSASSSASSAASSSASSASSAAAAEEEGGVAARWAAVCSRAGAAGRAMAKEQAALAAGGGAGGGSGWTAHANTFCRGADKHGATKQPDAAACRARCSPLGAACFQHSRSTGTCRCAAPRWYGLQTSDLGFTAWVRNGARPDALPSTSEGRRLLTAKSKRARGISASAPPRRRPSTGGAALSRYLNHFRSLPLELHCVRAVPAPDTPSQMKTSISRGPGPEYT